MLVSVLQIMILRAPKAFEGEYERCPPLIRHEKYQAPGAANYPRRRLTDDEKATIVKAGSISPRGFPLSQESQLTAAGLARVGQLSGEP